MTRLTATVARRASGLLSAAVVAATSALVAVVALTFEAPGVPPVTDMTEVTSTNPHLSERCKGGGGVGTPTTTTCYRTLTLDDGTKLDWPWNTSRATEVERADRYLRQHAPIRVHFWGGTVYQIVVANGHTYLTYDRAEGAQLLRQRFWSCVGMIVAASSVLAIALDLQRAHRGRQWPDRLASATRGVSGWGGLLLLLYSLGNDRAWWPALALALLAAVTHWLKPKILHPTTPGPEPVPSPAG